MKISDYIAGFMIEKGINQVFTVVGGGAMHLNDSFGHNEKMQCVYNHHEQASAMAAEGYAKICNKPALLCITSGPGAINALNGVVGAYQDSIPMLILSGQTKTALTVKNSGLHLRTLGNQEFDIVSALGNMTKYAEMITNPMKIRYCLEKAYYFATTGRMGPCWLDIPIDIQAAFVDTDKLQGYCEENGEKEKNNISKNMISDIAVQVVERIGSAKRPVIYAGNGIRLSNGMANFRKLIDKFKIPVVTCWDSIDLIETESVYYCGRAGTMGDRAGNFAVQNSDLIIAIGSRMNIYQVGYNVNTWARAAYTIVVDIDSEELKKPTVRIDMPICMDANWFMDALLCVDNTENCSYSDWIIQCSEWKKNYPVLQNKHLEIGERVNVYAFIDKLSRNLPENSVSVVANGSASVVGSQTYYLHDGDRFLMNCGMSSMGYGLPAAIGAAQACREDSHVKQIVCIEGDGSIMMNLQELQTVSTNEYPIKIFVINNGGYHQIRQTQNNIFRNGLVGVGLESGDLGFPDFEKIAEAFRIPYCSILDSTQTDEVLSKVMVENQAVLCEVFVGTDQIFEPKSATKRLEDGSLFSPPLEDMAPFLSRDELKRNMYIPLVEEN